MYLGSNQPRTQIFDTNADTYTPDWTTTAGRLVVTPVVYANQTAIALTDSALTITWKRKDGSGADGAAGQNAVVFSLYAPEGTVFVNHVGTLPIMAAAYDGATAITSGAAYAWAKYQPGSWLPLSEITDTLLVDGEDVLGTATYRCQMTYGGKTYQDVITLIDRTDNYQATIDSTAGTIFKNAMGDTYLICRLWQSGAEIDTLRSMKFGATAPTSPTTGDFYYKTSSGSPNTTLMRYNGTTWADVTDNAAYQHEYVYTWYRRDKDGEPMDSGDAFAEGKVIYVTDADVEVKTVFTCEVE